MSRHRARSHKDCASLLPLSAHPRTPLASIPHLAAVQGVIENGSPKIPNLLGKVIGIFLGLILFMRLVVMLVITLGDGIVYSLTNALNRQIWVSVTNFVNLHLQTAEVV